jgi:hypothetical protein
LGHCPYPRCQSDLPRQAQRCPSCRQALQWCACGAPNRVLARYCRLCRAPLRPLAEWRQPRCDAAASGSLPVSLPSPLRLVEAERLTLGGKLSAQCVSAHGHLFFPILGVGVAVYRIHDMARLAVIPLPADEVVQGLAAGEEYLLIASRGGLKAVPLLPLLTEGDLELHTWLGEPVVVSYGPALLSLDEHAVALAVTQGALHAFSLKEPGRPVWSCQRQGGGTAMLAYTAGLVVVVEQTGQVWAVDPVGGQVRWRQRLNEEVAVRAGVTASQGRLYLITRESSQLCIGLVEHGRLMQTASYLPDAKGMAAADSLLFVAGGDGLFRVSSVESEPVCISEQPFLAAPLLTPEALIGGSASGALVLMDPRAHFPRDQLLRGTEDLVVTTPLYVGDRVLLASQSGEVVLYQHRTGGDTP